MKTPCLQKIFGHKSYISQIIANFVLKFRNFRYYGNKGQSLVNLNDTIKLRILENPHVPNLVMFGL